LPVPAGSAFCAVLDGHERTMCCAGCSAVAQAISQNGLSSYYASRTAYAPRGEEAPEALTLYDRPELQAAFARRIGEHEREALLILEGITCAACVWLNERHLARLPGVLAVQANYATRRALVRWDERAVELSSILAAVAAIGYRAWPAASMSADAVRARENRAALWRLFVAGFGMMQVMMYAVPVYLAADGSMSADIRALMHLAGFVLTVPVVAYSAAPFFRGAWRDLVLRRLGLDVSVALGIAVAFGASVFAALSGRGEVYFDSITMFVFFVLCGRYLELRARQKAAAGLDYLDHALPLAAHRLTAFPALDTETVPAASLQPGDRVLVRSGESFPADGRILQGETHCDESLLTGESAPVRKLEGAAVAAGAVNRTSPVCVQIEQVGEATRLSAIRRLVERSSAQRPGLVETADRVAAWFVGAVLLVAAASALVWLHLEPARALWIAVAVLVVTCPCALSLATPAALTVAAGRLARRGVVTTRAHALELLARVTHVVFDKTGTLTEGRLALSKTRPLGTLTSVECLALAAALEQGSEHPVAAAFLQARPAGVALPLVQGLRNVPGAGMEARIAGVRYRIGSERFVAAIAGAPPTLAQEHGALTDIWLGCEGQWLAMFALADRLRPEAVAAIRRLQELDKQVLILSGDALPAVSAVAQRLGILRFEAALSPEDKQRRVQALQSHGAIVAMVGDGVNDAPVLAQAHLGIAMGGGAELSQVQADIVLLSGDLRALLDAVDIGRFAWRVIRQNLAWAIAYNLVALPLAVAGVLTPWMAGIGMGASSLLVVLNALRLMPDRHPAGEPAEGAAPASVLPHRSVWMSSTS
jgi:Cu2+-exporting ATPase